MKKNNKGFSLVELIVVVLIMGILAVALTPQVLRWVERSRIADDFATMDTVKSALQTALTNETVYKNNQTTQIKIQLKKGDCKFTAGNTTVGGKELLLDYLGASTWGDVDFKSSYTAVIEATSTGNVKATMFNTDGDSVTGIDQN